MTSSEEKENHSKEPEPTETFEIFHNPTWRMELLNVTHANYCKGVVFKRLPDFYQDIDMSKMTFLQFAITSLELLQTMEKLNKDNILNSEEKSDIIEWIYLHLVSNPQMIEHTGFMGSSTFRLIHSEETESHKIFDYSSTHLTMTFGALVSLLTLGDDLTRIDRSKILTGVKFLQNKDGSFRAGHTCSENDLRFAYSAVSICYILNDFSQINVPKLLQFIKSSFTYEGSFGSKSGTEGHAAYTFCAIASLVLLGELKNVLSSKEIELLKKWCLFRQESGFKGRPNKDVDTCYSFWVGATLDMLDSLGLINRQQNIDYILHNQNPFTGGIGKNDNEHTDPLHTHMGIAGLSIVKYQNLNSIYSPLIMSQNAYERLKKLQLTWVD